MSSVPLLSTPSSLPLDVPDLPDSDFFLPNWCDPKSFEPFAFTSTVLRTALLSLVDFYNTLLDHYGE